jgi:hypothetical protein
MPKNISLWWCFLLLFMLEFHGLCDEGSLLIKNWQKKDDIIKVEDDRSNLYIEQGNAVANIADTPKNCSAYRIASRSENIEWRPKWYFIGIGGVRIADAALSSDKSLLALVENTGKISGLSGSRLVLLNTYNNRIVSIIELQRRKVNKICFIPGTEKIVCAADRQIKIKQPVSLMLVNCKSREIEDVNQSFSDKIRDLAVSKDGSSIFILGESSKQILMLKTEEWTSKPEPLKNNVGKPSLLAVSRGNTLLAPSTGMIRQYDAVTGQYFNLINLPADFTPTAIIQDPDSEAMVLLENRGRAYFLNRKRIRKFFDGIGNTGTYMGERKTLAALTRSGSIAVFDLPGYNIQKRFIKANDIRPKTKGSILKIWFLPVIPNVESATTSGKRKEKKATKSKKRQKPKRASCVMALDSLGNLMTLQPGRRRWKKALIFSPKK